MITLELLTAQLVRPPNGSGFLQRICRAGFDISG
jgi:hypothetical protein